eukprot:8099747-Prorocentrum_lima.AAC.1
MDLFFLPDPSEARRHTSDSSGRNQQRLDPELLNPSNTAGMAAPRKAHMVASGVGTSKTLRQSEARSLFEAGVGQDGEDVSRRSR